MMEREMSHHQDPWPPAGASALPFDVLAVGRFPPSRVAISFQPEPRPSTAELDAAIAATWQRELERARGTNRMLFNGELLRYVRHEALRAADGERFDLTVGPTCYRDFVGTNLYGGQWLAKCGWETFSNAVGTTATVITADNQICYGRRSERVSYHAGHVHTFGGALESADRAADGSIDAFASVARELKEELGLALEELRDFICVGMIRDREIHQPEMLFEARLDLTAAELRDRWEAAESRDEHDDIVSLANEPDAIVPFIKSCGPIAPVAIGALFLHGRLTWGEDWFLRAGKQLN